MDNIAVCSTCGVEKPQTLENFYSHPKAKSGFHSSCIVCMTAKRKETCAKSRKRRAKSATEDSKKLRIPSLEEIRDPNGLSLYLDEVLIGIIEGFVNRDTVERICKVLNTRKDLLDTKPLRELSAKVKDLMAKVALERKG